MIVELCTNTLGYDDTWAFMMIPCSGWYKLAIKKTGEYQSGKCPICGKDIYVASNGIICGHMDD